jgi:hypothetical protein
MLISAYRVYYVFNNNILMCICVVFQIHERIYDYLCMLFVGDDVKRRSRHIIR